MSAPSAATRHVKDIIFDALADLYEQTGYPVSIRQIANYRDYVTGPTGTATVHKYLRELQADGKVVQITVEGRAPLGYEPVTQRAEVTV
jgi:NADPH:quinone reductase-like Zn-dependent oxidoreductase